MTVRGYGIWAARYRLRAGSTRSGGVPGPCTGPQSECGASASLVEQVLGQQGDRTAGRTLVLAAAGPGGSGDMHMRPAIGLGETRQEAGGGDGAGLGPADVGAVGEGAVQLLLVLGEQRQLPAAVIGVAAGAQQWGHQRVVIARDAGGMRTQGDHAGT